MVNESNDCHFICSQPIAYNYNNSHMPVVESVLEKIINGLRSNKFVLLDYNISSPQIMYTGLSVNLDQNIPAVISIDITSINRWLESE